MFAAAVLPVSAQVYKWVDENGVTHYGERAPQGRTATEVPNRLATPAPEGPSTQATPDPAASPASRADQEKAPPEAARRRENCRQQRELLARLRRANNARGPGESAETSGPDREATLARQEQLVLTACSP